MLARGGVLDWVVDRLKSADAEDAKDENSGANTMAHIAAVNDPVAGMQEISTTYMQTSQKAVSADKFNTGVFNGMGALSSPDSASTVASSSGSSPSLFSGGSGPADASPTTASSGSGPYGGSSSDGGPTPQHAQHASASPTNGNNPYRTHTAPVAEPLPDSGDSAYSPAMGFARAPGGACEPLQFISHVNTQPLYFSSAGYNAFAHGGASRGAGGLKAAASSKLLGAMKEKQD